MQKMPKEPAKVEFKFLGYTHCFQCGKDTFLVTGDEGKCTSCGYQMVLVDNRKTSK